jgi:hypothetical protein
VELNLGEGNTLLGFVQNISIEKNIFSKLENADTIINSLDEDIKNRVLWVNKDEEDGLWFDEKKHKKITAEEFQKFIYFLYEDDEFMRQLEYVSTVKDNIEASLEYFGFDYISAPDFTYNNRIEIRIRYVRKLLSKFYGGLIRELSKGVDLEL